MTTKSVDYKNRNFSQFWKSEVQNQDHWVKNQGYNRPLLLLEARGRICSLFISGASGCWHSLSCGLINLQSIFNSLLCLHLYVYKISLCLSVIQMHTQLCVYTTSSLEGAFSVKGELGKWGSEERGGFSLYYIHICTVSILFKIIIKPPVTFISICNVIFLNGIFLHMVLGQAP